MQPRNIGEFSIAAKRNETTLFYQGLDRKNLTEAHAMLTMRFISTATSGFQFWELQP